MKAIVSLKSQNTFTELCSEDKVITIMMIIWSYFRFTEENLFLWESSQLTFSSFNSFWCSDEQLLTSIERNAWCESLQQGQVIHMWSLKLEEKKFLEVKLYTRTWILCGRKRLVFLLTILESHCILRWVIPLLFHYGIWLRNLCLIIIFHVSGGLFNKDYC